MEDDGTYGGDANGIHPIFAVLTFILCVLGIWLFIAPESCGWFVCHVINLLIKVAQFIWPNGGNN